MECSFTFSKNFEQVNNSRTTGPGIHRAFLIEKNAQFFSKSSSKLSKKQKFPNNDVFGGFAQTVLKKLIV